MGANRSKGLAFLIKYPILAALPIYIGGVVWRWQHVLERHDPRAAVYSDMGMYIGVARRLALEGYKMKPIDVTHPPATSWLFAQFYQLDKSYFYLVLLQIVVAALIPLAVGLLAWAAFDQRCAAWSVALSSCYYYHVEYAGFFLSEVYMMLLIPACMACYLLAVKSKSLARTLLFGGIGGVLFLIAVAFKTVAAPAILGFCAVHWLLTPGSRRKKTLAIATLCLVTIPGLVPISARCTRANSGKFCLQSNKSAADFLLGHYDRVHSIRWTDSEFGNPSADQHGYEQVSDVPFSITDSKRNFQTAWDWIRSHKTQALVLSVQHVFDLFSPNAPWPSIWTPEWPTAQGQMYLFVIFLIWPSCLLLFDIARSGGPLAMLRSLEFALFSVIFGVIVAVLIASGEPRYRLPFDCVFIVLGVQFYRRMFARHAWRLVGRPYRMRHAPG